MPKIHWYAFAFSGQNQEGDQVNASTYMGYMTMGISIPRIVEAKQLAGVTIDSVLMSVCYLGHMTDEEMKGKP